MRPDAPICEWFALCNQKATGVRKHPLLGFVHICTRCAAKLRAIEEKK